MKRTVPTTIELARGSSDSVELRLEDHDSRTVYLQVEIPTYQLGRLLGTLAHQGTGHTDDDPPFQVELNTDNVGLRRQTATVLLGGIHDSEAWKDRYSTACAYYAEQGWRARDREFNYHLTDRNEGYRAIFVRYVEPGTPLDVDLADGDKLVSTYGGES